MEVPKVRRQILSPKQAKDIGWDVPLMLAVLNRDCNRGYHNPFSGLLVKGDHPNVECLGLLGISRVKVPYPESWPGLQMVPTVPARRTLNPNPKP